MYNVSEKWEWLTTFYFKKMDHLVHVKEVADIKLKKLIRSINVSSLVINLIEK